MEANEVRVKHSETKAHLAANLILKDTYKEKKISLKFECPKLRISAQFSAAGTLSIIRDPGGPDEQAMIAADCLAGRLYIGEIDLGDDYDYDFKYSVNCNIHQFIVKET